jgi:hypothetical protein
MVRSFRSQKGRPLVPILRSATSGELPDSTWMKRAIKSSTGSRRMSKRAAEMRSPNIMANGSERVRNRTGYVEVMNCVLKPGFILAAAIQVRAALYKTLTIFLPGAGSNA